MKLIMGLLMALFFASAITGCATPKYNYTALETSVREPVLGSSNTSHVGDIMLRQGKYKEHDSIYVKDKIDVIWAYTLMPGYYLKQGEDDVGVYYYPGGDEPGHVDKAMLADPWKSIMARKDPPAICVITMFNVATCNTMHQNYFERRKKPLAHTGSFEQTLIYGGRLGDKINIGYREYSGNMTRPAFSNNVEYDLSQSMLIGYKGAKIEVIEANNQQIKYKVIESFTPAN
ncbi:hypothetical protein SAMN05216420_101341 [Nitrosospira sp. Nl5]|uniref:hypothetical protein n=1 Tax=Nitrosospira sp. Nl5 TaxID=200120 RepID=UPI0008864821|nr:hypothetical protein [Nitrosospira sp. Nl5]SCX92181.1 hypothetical protein SAMN05216420_101341 [Nitrosospira sp. Nl5]